MTGIPTQIGPYTITREIGRGGMGVVYLARDTKLDRDVAIKALPRDVVSSPDRFSRFTREAKTLASLNHSNIATIFGLEQAEGHDYLVMEYIEGESLAARIHAGSIPWQQATGMAVEIAEALAAAHAKGVVHRDIKPDNVMLSASGSVKILDFGLAKLTSPTSGEATTVFSLQTVAGTVLGTVPYMSPEQVEGRPADFRSDVFSFGAVLYEMLTGECAFRGSSTAALMSSILRDAPAPVSAVTPEAPPPLGQIVNRCLAKSPEDRYASADELANDLRALLNRETVTGVQAVSLPLVGREAERGPLLEALDRARRGHGSLILLGGEPGIGKTHLVNDMLDQARSHGLLAVSGHAYEEEGAPYIMSAEILDEMIRQLPADHLRELLGDAASELSRILPALRRRFPGIPPPADLPPEQQRRYLFTCCLEFLERATAARPIVMLLDDLHWSDESSLLLLEHIAQRIERMSLLLLGTYRDVELDVRKPFEKSLTRLVRQKLALRIPIRRLTEADIAALLAELGGADPPPALVSAIFRESEGNPFFATELFEHLAEEGFLFDDAGRWRDEMEIHELEVPEGVRLVIGRRLERLSDATTPVLTAAAVIGQRFDLATLIGCTSAAADSVLDALDEAVAAKLLTPTPDRRESRYDFVHALIRHTLLETLSPPRRQRMHLRVADALEDILGDRVGPRVADIAHHLYQAGGMADAQRTREYLALAAQASLDASAGDEAVTNLNRALEMLEFEDAPDAEARAELLFQRGDAYRAVGRWDKASEDWHLALPVFESAGQRERVARICRDLAHQQLWQNNAEEARALVARGLESIGGQASISHCRLLAMLGYAFSVKGELVASEEAHDRALAMAETLDDPALLGGEVLVTRIYLYQHSHRPSLMAKTGERATALARRFCSPWDLSNALGGTFMAWLHEGRFAEIAAKFDEAMALARRTGDLGNEWHLLVTRGCQDLSRGELAAARKHFEEATAFARDRSFPWYSIPQAMMGLVDFYLGAWTSSRDNLDVAVSNHIGECWKGTEGACRLVAMAYFDPHEARKVLDAEVKHLPTPGVLSPAGQWMRAAAFVEAAAWLQRTELAASLYPLMQQVLDEGGYWYSIFGLAHKLAAIAAAAGKQWDTAMHHFDEAMRQVEELPYLLDEPEILRWRAWTLIERNEQGDRAEAESLLAEATVEYDRLGMKRHGEIVAELLGKIY